MMGCKKLQGFTILETIISLLLISIIISMIYLLITLINKQFENIKTNNEKLYNYLSFKNHFETDYFISENVYSSKGSLTFTTQTNNTIRYYFYKDSIIRKVDNSYLKYTIPVIHVDTSEIYGQYSLIKIKIKLLDENFELNLYKDYGISRKINNSKQDDYNNLKKKEKK